MIISLSRTGIRRWAPALVALAAWATTAGPSAAEVATDWMDGTSQWSVGFVENGPQSYCSIVWNSETGRTVEFRQGLKIADWRLTDSAWNLTDSAPATVVLAGQTKMLAIKAVADTRTSLNISDHGNVVRAIIQNAISGTVDLSLAVGDHGEQWEVPISRIYSMHSGVSKCLTRLKSRPIAEPTQQDELP